MVEKIRSFLAASWYRTAGLARARVACASPVHA
jgi:hypothetical protein